MKVNERVAYAHKRMCDDDRFGYSWEERHGASYEKWTIDGTQYSISVGDYDCSSSTIDAWRMILSQTKYRGALDAATYTGNMRSVFVASGLFEWKPMSFLAEPGDLYLNEANHVAMCQTQVPDVLSEFCISETGGTTGKRGDQTGREAYAHAYYDYPWDGILHYTGKADGTTATTTKRMQVSTKASVSRLHGIDISSHQADIDVTKVEADFVIVKVSGGVHYVNPYWKKQAQAAMKSGKLLGLYHYACEDGTTPGGKAEAEFFLKQVKGYEGKAVMCLDFEADAQLQPVSYAKAWLDAVAKATNSTPMFYAYASYLNSRDHSVIANYPLWMASYLNRYEWGRGYVDNPDNTWDTSSWKAMTMYQYASTATISGYGGRLDVNVFYGTKDDWRKLMGASDEPQPKYRIKYGATWQSEMQGMTDLGGSERTRAGKAGTPALYFACDAKRYRVKTKEGWLPWRSKYDVKSTAGYSGDGNPILAVQIDDDSIQFRAHPVGGKWFDYMVGQTDLGGSRDKYAGDGVTPIDCIQMFRVGTSGRVQQKPDNSTLAKAACSLAYSRPAQHNPSTKANARTELYGKVYDTLFKASDTKSAAPRCWNVQGRSCDRGIASIVRWSGVDDSMPRACASIYDHMAKSERWKDLGRWDGKESSLKPGDILIHLERWQSTKSNHVCMYVGKSTAKEVYASWLKGTDADKGAPTGAWVSAHRNGGNPPNKGYAPCIGDAKYAYADKTMHVFRCVKPQGSTKYTGIGK